MLAAKETATIPNLAISEGKLTRGWIKANQNLQFDEWALQDCFAGAIIDKATGESLEYRELIKRPETRETWFKSLANEIGCLAQGIRDIKGTDTIFFIPKYEIPKERLKEVTYARIVVDYKPHKPEKKRLHITARGDRINCDYDTSAPTCDLTTIKLH